MNRGEGLRRLRRRRRADRGWQYVAPTGARRPCSAVPARRRTPRASAVQGSQYAAWASLRPYLANDSAASGERRCTGIEVRPAAKLPRRESRGFREPLLSKQVKSGGAGQGFAGGMGDFHSSGASGTVVKRSAEDCFFRANGVFSRFFEGIFRSKGVFQA